MFVYIEVIFLYFCFYHICGSGSIWFIFGILGEDVSCLFRFVRILIFFTSTLTVPTNIVESWNNSR